MTWWVCKRCRVGPGIRVFPFEDESIEYRGLCKRCLEKVAEIRSGLTQQPEQRNIEHSTTLLKELLKLEADKISTPLSEEPVTYSPDNHPLTIPQPTIKEEEEI